MNHYDTLELLAIALVAAFSDEPAANLQPIPATGLMPDWVRATAVSNPRPYESRAN